MIEFPAHWSTENRECSRCGTMYTLCFGPAFKTGGPQQVIKSWICGKCEDVISLLKVFDLLT